MPFKSKVQIAAEAAAKAAINPEKSGDASAKDTEKNVKKENGAAAEIKLKRDLYEKDKEVDQLKKELEDLRAQKATEPVTAAPDSVVIAQLQGQIDNLSRQVIGANKGKKLFFRSPTALDVQEEVITFTARSVVYVVASYVDAKGLEKLPPFKLIIFQYAASDIRKEGREEEIKNFSQFNTNLKPEIEFLRSHPLYGIAFSENTNEMMNEDVKDIQFKTRAATQIQTMSPEDVFSRSQELDLPNWRNKSASELKPILLHKMVKVYKKEESQLREDILRRQAVGLAALQERQKE
jgi:hypothetical protein